LRNLVFEKGKFGFAFHVGLTGEEEDLDGFGCIGGLTDEWKQ
jgi:hypothetical protein